MNDNDGVNGLNSVSQQQQQQHNSTDDNVMVDHLTLPSISGGGEIVLSTDDDLFIVGSPSFRGGRMSLSEDLNSNSVIRVVRPQCVVRKLEVPNVEVLTAALPTLVDNENAHVWIDMTSRSSEHIDEFCQYFKLHPLTNEDIRVSTSGLEQEKVEVFEQYAYVQTHALNDHHEVDTPIPIKLVIFDKLILSVHPTDVNPLTEHLRWYSNQHSERLQTSYTVYALLKAVTAQLVHVVQMVATEIDTIDHLISVLSHSERSDLTLRMGGVRRQITHCANLIEPKGMVIKSMMRHEDSAIFSNPHLLHDLLDQNTALSSRLSISQDLISSIQSMYLARASLAVADASHKLNTAMSRLSVVATITLPLTLITSFWGMNVRVPGQHMDGEGSVLNFFLIVIFEVLALLVGVYYFHRKGYL